MVPGHSLLDVSVTDEEVKLGGAVCVCVCVCV